MSAAEQPGPTGDDPVARAYAEGYRDGYLTGRDIGYAQAEWAMTQAWARVARTIRRIALGPSHDELAARRRAVPDRPCGAPACQGCSTCIRAAWVARHGGDYPGLAGRPRPVRRR